MKMRQMMEEHAFSMFCEPSFPGRGQLSWKSLSRPRFISLQAFPPATKASNRPWCSFFTNTSGLLSVFSTVPALNRFQAAEKQKQELENCSWPLRAYGPSPPPGFWSNTFAADLSHTSTAHFLIAGYQHPTHIDPRKLYTRKQTAHRAEPRQWERKKIQMNDCWASQQE